jgi:hypothetical protein
MLSENLIAQVEHTAGSIDWFIDAHEVTKN